MSTKRKAGSLDPVDVPLEKEAKKEEKKEEEEEEEIWILVRQGEWRIDVQRKHLYAANAASEHKWFEASIDHDTNTLELPAGTCATRTVFMLFFGTMMSIETSHLEPSAQQYVQVLHLADYCHCNGIVKKLLSVAEHGLQTQPAPLTAKQFWQIGSRFKKAKVLENSVNKLHECDAPPDAEMMADLWPVLRQRLKEISVLARVREAIKKFRDCPRDFRDILEGIAYAVGM